MGGPLSAREIDDYQDQGFVQPVDAITATSAAALCRATAEHIAGVVPTERYELTDDITVERIESEDGTTTYEYRDEQQTIPHTLPFLFNVWRLDDRFRQIALDPHLGAMARQLLGCQDVLLMEDNVVAKMAGAGTVPWHQDISYWPIEECSAVTLWIALDRIGPENGAMIVVPGSHTSAEHLPVQFRDAATFMHQYRPDVPELTQHPEREGHRTVSYALNPGQAGFHHPLLWHGSTPNRSADTRVAYVLRYVASGTTWLGSSRVPYDDVGCAVGQALSPEHFPLVPSQ